MARIKEVLISNYRSIEDLRIVFPSHGPLILLGENNAGKSNIVRALQLPLGPFYPSNHEPEDHEFFARDRDRVICIEVDFDTASLFGGRYSKLVWRYDRSATPPVYYRGLPGQRGFQDGWINNDATPARALFWKLIAT
jgi:putative ATP-dependent endonuclease of OLD family